MTQNLETNSAVTEIAAMDAKLKEGILKLTVEWPLCLYSKQSKRNAAGPSNEQQPQQSTTIERTMELLMPLTGWNKFPVIAIDGMNGTGKSSLIQSMNRRYVKVNDLMPNVTHGSSYNHEVFKSMQYMMLQMLATGENCCWDRCAYSNYMFYFVHQLMYIYRDGVIPSADDTNEVYGHLNNIAISVNLLNTLTLFEPLFVPTVFIVCRDVRLIGEALRNRGGLNDVYNSKEHNYQMAQYHVYRYFGEILRIPVFDLVDAFRLGLNLGEFHFLLRRKLDTQLGGKRTISPDSQEPSDSCKNAIELPDGTDDAVKLDKFIDHMINRETLLYDYSNK